ncbi:MAG: ABC transporter ATP-binding protein [Nitrososphaerota archaeon]|nr:ABC transporter ATP-binding protein [Nitrososphaerota archaeon]
MSLQAQDVVSGYGQIEIVHGISLRAEESKITGIIGPNGSGKSTFLKTLYGFVKPWKGRITFEGKEITDDEPSDLIRSGIGYLMQRRSTFPYLTVHQNLKLGGWTFGKDEEKRRRAEEEVYENFPQLKGRRNTLAGSLSGGEQRMIELGRVLMTKPKLILVDEFSTGLSPKVFKMLYEKLAYMSREQKTTILAVDQNVVEVASVADYMYVFRLGKIQTEGPASDFRGKLDQVTASWLRA